MEPNEPFVVVVTGAAGNVGSTLCFQLLEKSPFKTERRLLLRMVDLPETINKMKGLKMEMEDCGFPGSPIVETWQEDPSAYTKADCIVLVGGRPRGPGMQRKDLLKANVALFIEQAKMVSSGKPNPNCKVIVVANPCNTNALFFASQVTGIRKENITSMSLLDEMRAKAIVADHIKADSVTLKEVIVWGNHSDTLFVDVDGANLNVTDQWRLEELQTKTRERGASVIKVKGTSSVYSAAKATLEHISKLYNGTKNEVVSMGIVSNYFGEELCVTGPVSISDSGEIRALFDRKERLSKTENELIQKSIEELKEEKRMATE